MSKDSKNSKQFLPLSQEEMDELDDFLMSDATSDETLMLDALDGYLTAIVSGPITLKLSEWLPGIWGPSEQDNPTFKTKVQAQRIHELIIRHMNSIIWSLHDDPDAYEPIFGARIYEAQEYIDAEMWAYGYMRGVELCREQWQPILDDPNGSVALRPIRLHTAVDVTPEEELLIKTPIQREELAKQIPASVAWIYRYWLPYRRATFERSVATTFQREHPKIGRNDPCLCGSGKKYKKCCGIAMTLH
ncbi:UPF0149 family protein [Nitrosomonas communis]|uniref:YecA family protein n=1 Tax=Nitrosomonas communis TaxID=44574 RepID=A0A1I4U454_9PROT|nr:UPF0149 family protein [Nitrosomonas communis]SFM83689.1 uncharacterized protein SAMN05421863_10597 [Nitrosomonas communis]